jgi:hypothetical protein
VVIGCKQSSILQLVELAQNPKIVGCKFFNNMEHILSVKEGMLQLVGIFQNLRIVGGNRFFRRMNFITPKDEDFTVKLVWSCLKFHW